MLKFGLLTRVDWQDITVNGEIIRLKLFDTAGQERFNQVTASFYRSANACLLCFDLTRKETFARLACLFAAFPDGYTHFYLV